jgi:ATP-binding cassette subfamily B (MDR/TAP) protein 1
LVQDGSAERVPIAFSFIATFITGFALAYARSWRLALALSSILPVIMIFGAIMFVVLKKVSSKSLEAVAKGGTLAEEVIGSIRTVQAFGTSVVLGQKYREFIAKSDKAQKGGSPIEGGGLAIMCKSWLDRLDVHAKK